MNKFEITIPKNHEAFIVNGKVFIQEKKPAEVPADDKYPKSVFDLPVDGTWWIGQYGTIDEMPLDTGNKRSNNEICHLSTEPLANAFKALIQLKELCDAWNKVDGFSADWTNDRQHKYCINVYNNSLQKEKYHGTQIFLHFQSPETRDLFYTRFQELIILAKDLL